MIRVNRNLIFWVTNVYRLKEDLTQEKVILKEKKVTFNLSDDQEENKIKFIISFEHASTGKVISRNLTFQSVRTQKVV